ncbi:SDR family NAD(P)-dependent oxidoreductase [Nocardioides acrostichi]|nr:SDR family NAD(P)-dependent oxidoreductase [Nocardioides acrostichi]
MEQPVDVWRLADIGDQAGRTVVVTGPSVGGIGYFTALELARRGARVVLAGRSQAKLDEAAGAIAAEVTQASLELLRVDLADLDSVRAAGGRAGSVGAIDLVVNNAGVMAPATGGAAAQWATNHYGPFLLTGLLLPQLIASGAGRVVTVSSLFHRVPRSARFDDPRSPHGRGRESAYGTYGRTKLANLLFTYGLDRRCREAEIPVKALAAHPGFAGTHLALNGPFGGRARGAGAVLDAVIRATGQSPAAGAQPTLMAATADLPGTTFCGPSGPGEFAGHPQVVRAAKLAYDESAQDHLWTLSEQITGLHYP